MYKSKLHQGKKRNFEVLDAIEFLHRVCLHIPGHYEALIRYYGHYANAARGKRKKLGLEIELPLKIIDDAPNRKTYRRSIDFPIVLLCQYRVLDLKGNAERT